MTRIPRIVIDTNVFLSALKSSKGASFQLLFLIGEGRFETSVSVPLVLEYEHAALKSADLKISAQEIDDIIDYICKVSHRHKVFYLWRPFLKDPNDDFVLELAVGSQSDFIITFNKVDFRGVEKFGIRVATPKEFLAMIGEKQ
ncbi:putative toxin-antitoxin system toxin component, PIN family [bacterium]|nr:putative toxin-antitoxin system toxin component, PIN family [bacterium]